VKTTIYTTNEYGEYTSKPINYGVSLSGVTTAFKTEHIVNTDFLGFGVAITGSSCYNLSLMEKADRNALLKNLYSPCA
jgi:hypothetical protein